MYHENTTFTLVHYWLESREGWSLGEKQEAFNMILESDVLRFHHMDMIYLAAYAFRTPWMQGSDQDIADIVQRAVLMKAGCKRRDGTPFTTSRSWKTLYKFHARVPQQMCSALRDRESIQCFLGLARGLPIYLDIQRLSQDGGTSNLGLYVGWSSGGLPMHGKRSSDMVPDVNIGLILKAAHPRSKFNRVPPRPFDENLSRGWPSCISPWEQASAFTSNRIVDDNFSVYVMLSCIGHDRDESGAPGN